MLILFLGILDLVCAISILANKFIPIQLLVACSFYLIIKGGIFTLQKDIISFFDILVGIYIIAILLGFSNIIISIILAIFLIQKFALAILK